MDISLNDGFFAPASTDLIDNLIGQYKSMRSDIERIGNTVLSHGASVSHFISGNVERRARYHGSVIELFNIEGAIASLNSEFWSRVLNLTDVYEYMPNNRRNEWNEQIMEMKTPDFNEDTVRPTIMELLNSRQQFFSERVDGIFRALSGEHVTNRPEGFGKRMILVRVFDSYGMVNYEISGYIHDLRHIIAKFMGRNEPEYGLTRAVLNGARRCTGEWFTIDGGALRIRVYIKGSAHLEVHPEMAWRLNCILAHLYPMAIPPAFRQKPKKELKGFVMMGQPLPFAVLKVLTGMKVEPHTPMQRSRWEEPRPPLTTNPFNRRLDWCDEGKGVYLQVEKVLENIGGVLVNAGALKNIQIWEFNYEPARVLDEIIASGCIPEQKSHQFYPTPGTLAARCVALAEIGPADTCLEPSAGIGGIADYLPNDRTTCVEISPLHCKILESKGFHVETADFIKWAEGNRKKFDRVVMNPPFSEGRALAHVQAAVGCLKPDGKLVAIMPAGSRGKDVIPGWALSWSEPISNEFAGTHISVVILIATHRL